VESGSSRKKPTPRRNTQAKSDGGSAGPDVQFDTKGRSIQVCDTRIINSEQRAFCRRLLEAAARRPGISKAEVDLARASCRIEFVGKAASSRKMADFFADCVQEAAGGLGDAEKNRYGRNAQDWLKLTAFPLANDVSLWETFDAESGRVRLRHQSPGGDEHQLPRMAEAISRLEDVERCEAFPRSRSLTIDFRHSKEELNGFVDQAEQSLESLLAAETTGRSSISNGVAPEQIGHFEMAKGPKRLLYLALAGGSFMMTLVGLVIPGIPTVPFLLATGYFLARSSRRLDRKLRESLFFGPILTEWEQSGALGSQSKAKLIGLTGAVVAVTIILIPLSPVVIIVLLLISSLGIYGVYRLPGLARAPRASVSIKTPRFALPAP
jgi:uncharacterized membrane protein YbaN (DUF454 family)